MAGKNEFPHTLAKTRRPIVSVGEIDDPNTKRLAQWALHATKQLSALAKEVWSLTQRTDAVGDTVPDPEVVRSALAADLPFIGTGGGAYGPILSVSVPSTVVDGDLVQVQTVVPFEWVAGAIGLVEARLYNVTQATTLSHAGAHIRAAGDFVTVTLAECFVPAAGAPVAAGDTIELQVDGTNTENFLVKGQAPGPLYATLSLSVVHKST